MTAYDEDLSLGEAALKLGLLTESRLIHASALSSDSSASRSMTSVEACHTLSYRNGVQRNLRPRHPK